jgi:hypothetical protein
MFGLIINSISFAHSVEFGQDAIGDPNAIPVQGSSGFLYSERIVFTAAHVIVGVGETTPEQAAQRVAFWERDGFVYAPGIGNRAGQKQYRVKKVLIAPTYRPRSGSDQTRIDDFAILILQESIPMRNKVVVGSDSDIATFIKEMTPVNMVGYGLQNPSQRTPPQYGTLSPRKMTSYLVSNEELRNYFRNNAQKISQNQTILDYGVPNSEKFGSVCDGDSGSGFFVEKGDTRYYLGLVGGLQAGIPNCMNESWSTFGVGGGMSGITATNKFVPLINEAELIVAEDKQRELKKVEDERAAAELKAKQEADAKAAAELKAKQEAEAKAAAELKAKQEADAKAAAELKAKQEADAKAAAELKAKQEADAKAAAELKAKQEADAKAAALKKTTITCLKGKLVKKVTAVKPVCPKGYKKK